jgi:hypothetical protein
MPAVASGFGPKHHCAFGSIDAQHDPSHPLEAVSFEDIAEKREGLHGWQPTSNDANFV